MCSPKVEKAPVIENGEIDISLLVSKIIQAAILTLIFILMMIVDYESYLM